MRRLEPRRDMGDLWKPYNETGRRGGSVGTQGWRCWKAGEVLDEGI